MARKNDPYDVVLGKINRNEQLTIKEFLLTKLGSAYWLDFEAWAGSNLTHIQRFAYEWKGMYDAFLCSHFRERAFNTPPDVREQIRKLGLELANVSNTQRARDAAEELDALRKALDLVILELNRISTGQYEAQRG